MNKEVEIGSAQTEISSLSVEKFAPPLPPFAFLFFPLRASDHLWPEAGLLPGISNMDIVYMVKMNSHVSTMV